MTTAAGVKTESRFEDGQFDDAVEENTPQTNVQPDRPAVSYIDEVQLLEWSEPEDEGTYNDDEDEDLMEDEFDDNRVEDEDWEIAERGACLSTRNTTFA